MASQHNYQFKSQWNVWIHKNASNDWSITGYDKIMTISNIKNFWEFLNNFDKINYLDNQIFIMRDNILPIWETPENRDGGAAIIRLKHTEPNLLNIWSDVCLLTMNEQICPIVNEINGISFNLKSDLVVIKIWNRNGQYECNKFLNPLITNKYKMYVCYYQNRTE